MPSSEDIINAEAEVKERAVEIVMEREKCSREFATKYVSKLSRDVLAELTGIQQGGAYAAW